TSARPGEAENMVIAGHHNMAGEVFRDLVTLTVGAEVSIFAGETEHRYLVTDVQVLAEKGMPLEVRQANGLWIGQTGAEMLTMVTCWPYNNNTHRVVVRALPVA
ncbi:MAG: sortase, partial [Anaerolineae bacterium]|nr:sortase [Anaerolineae bacterium]